MITSIFSKLASVCLSDDNEATYYLHAFIFCELKKRSMGMLNRMMSIAEMISVKTNFEDYDYMKFAVK